VNVEAAWHLAHPFIAVKLSMPSYHLGFEQAWFWRESSRIVCLRSTWAWPWVGVSDVAGGALPLVTQAGDQFGGRRKSKVVLTSGSETQAEFQVLEGSHRRFSSLDSNNVRFGSSHRGVGRLKAKSFA